MHKGKIPDKPYESSRVLSTKVTPHFHKQLRQIAADKDATVSAVVKAAIEQYVQSNTH
jgi:predicted transcriptional regulator